MLSQERQSLILDIIKEQGSVTVTRLTEILQSSESTVRRDLSYLASKGKINKVHGGATALGQEFIKLEDNIEEKLTKNTDEKTKIAQYAASQIQDDDFVFIDANKAQYIKDFELIHPLLKVGGIIVADDILSHADPVKPFVEEITHRDDYSAQILNLPDGVLIARKNK